MLSRWRPLAAVTQRATYVEIVETAKTADMSAMSPGPYLDAAKKAGMPSTIGDDPRMSSKAVRDDVACAARLSAASAWSAARSQDAPCSRNSRSAPMRTQAPKAMSAALVTTLTAWPKRSVKRMPAYQ